MNQDQKNQSKGLEGPSPAERSAGAAGKRIDLRLDGRGRPLHPHHVLPLAALRAKTSAAET